ncbi:MAG: hypothetical protein IPO26_21690 [Saprospiraceae bacterium]|nr:hypothetical protein [Saprospiraceae bacterium]
MMAIFAVVHRLVLNHLSGASYLWINGGTTASITVNPTVTSNCAVTTTYSFWMSNVPDYDYLCGRYRSDDIRQ